MKVRPPQISTIALAAGSAAACRIPSRKPSRTAAESAFTGGELMVRTAMSPSNVRSATELMAAMRPLPVGFHFGPIDSTGRGGIAKGSLPACRLRRVSAFRPPVRFLRGFVPFQGFAGRQISPPVRTRHCEQSEATHTGGLLARLSLDSFALLAMTGSRVSPERKGNLERYHVFDFSETEDQRKSQTRNSVNGPKQVPVRRAAARIRRARTAGPADPPRQNPASRRSRPPSALGTFGRSILTASITHSSRTPNAA